MTGHRCGTSPRVLESARRGRSIRATAVSPTVAYRPPGCAMKSESARRKTHSLGISPYAPLNRPAPKQHPAVCRPARVRSSSAAEGRLQRRETPQQRAQSADHRRPIANNSGTALVRSSLVGCVVTLSCHEFRFFPQRPYFLTQALKQDIQPGITKSPKSSRRPFRQTRTFRRHEVSPHQHQSAESCRRHTSPALRAGRAIASPRGSTRRDRRPV